MCKIHEYRSPNEAMVFQIRTSFSLMFGLCKIPPAHKYPRIHRIPIQMKLFYLTLVCALSAMLRRDIPVTAAIRLHVRLEGPASIRIGAAQRARAVLVPARIRGCVLPALQRPLPAPVICKLKSKCTSQFTIYRKRTLNNP